MASTNLRIKVPKSLMRSYRRYTKKEVEYHIKQECLLNPHTKKLKVRMPKKIWYEMDPKWQRGETLTPALVAQWKSRWDDFSIPEKMRQLWIYQKHGY